MPQIVDYVISIICGAVKSSTKVPILIQVDQNKYKIPWIRMIGDLFRWVFGYKLAINTHYPYIFIDVNERNDIN